MTDYVSEIISSREGVETRKTSDIYGASVAIVDGRNRVEIDKANLDKMSKVFDKGTEQEAQAAAEALPGAIGEDNKVAKEILDLWKKALADKRGLVGI